MTYDKIIINYPMHLPHCTVNQAQVGVAQRPRKLLKWRKMEGWMAQNNMGQKHNQIKVIVRSENIESVSISQH